LGQGWHRRHGDPHQQAERSSPHRSSFRVRQRLTLLPWRPNMMRPPQTSRLVSIVLRRSHL
jgi:hypothetical protein